MAVSLPTAADVRRAREQAARNAAERAEVARTPLLAVLGAGDYAVSTVVGAVTTARTRANERAGDVQQRVADFRTGVRGRAEGTYAGLAERGERAWGRIRQQPQVEQALRTIETYTEKLDTRVDDLVDDAHDAAESALRTVSRRTQITGDRVARSTQRFAGEAAETVADASAQASKAVADAGQDAATAIDEAGDEAAATARSTARTAADRTAPKTAPSNAARKPALRRTAAADATDTTSGSDVTGTTSGS